MKYRHIGKLLYSATLVTTLWGQANAWNGKATGDDISFANPSVYVSCSLNGYN